MSHHIPPPFTGLPSPLTRTTSTTGLKLCSLIILGALQWPNKDSFELQEVEAWLE